MTEPGRVYLVGAGPGDPGLMTVRGLEVLRRAGVVVYDRLVNPVLLDEAPPDALRIFAGKHAGAHCLPQAQINALLIEQARRGRLVVRLKGGDPFVFGRGGEEALALAEAGVPFEVVPGVSAAVAVPAYAGIPVTHRGLASAFAVVSGHAEDAYGPVLQSLAPGSATLVILMGIGTRAATSAMLLSRGWPADTPAAILFSASRPDAFSWRGTLGSVASAPATGAPGVIVIGATVALAALLQPAHAGGQSAVAR